MTIGTVARSAMMYTGDSSDAKETREAALSSIH